MHGWNWVRNVGRWVPAAVFLSVGVVVVVVAGGWTKGAGPVGTLLLGSGVTQLVQAWVDLRGEMTSAAESQLRDLDECRRLLYALRALPARDVDNELSPRVQMAASVLNAMFHHQREDWLSDEQRAELEAWAVRGFRANAAWQETTSWYDQWIDAISTEASRIGGR